MTDYVGSRLCRVSEHIDLLKFIKDRLDKTNDILTFSYKRQAFFDSLEEITDIEELRGVISDANADVCELRDNVKLLEHAFDDIRRRFEQNSATEE